jgi:acetolactate synthase I/II/III large subunit
LRNWNVQFSGILAHLDADPAVVGSSYLATLPIAGDARPGLELLLENVGVGRADPGHAELARKTAAAAWAQAREHLCDD